MEKYDFNCALNDSHGARGVTFWGPANTFSINPNGGSVTKSFTCTRPTCYQAKDNCLVSFNYFVGGGATDDDVGPLVIKVNGEDLYTPNYHSKISGHNVKVCVDLGPPGFDGYNDWGYNEIEFINQDTQATMSIALLEIRRVYGMCGPTYDEYCDDQVYPYINPACQSGSASGNSGNMDYSRSDHPCNEGRGGYSYVYFKDSSFNGLIQPGSSHSWTFSCAPEPPNYVSKDDCFFNFNQLYIRNDATSQNDVPFTISINGWGPLTYYHSKKEDHNCFVGINLGSFGGWYNDTGSNTITLGNPQNNEVALLVNDDINIYRMYRTEYL